MLKVYHAVVAEVYGLHEVGGMMLWPAVVSTDESHLLEKRWYCYPLALQKQWRFREASFPLQTMYSETNSRAADGRP